MKKIITAALIALTACAAAVKSIPSDVTLAVCIANGALNKEPVAQIALECKTDVPAVIAALLSSDNPAVTGSLAAAESRRTLTLAHDFGPK